jgi:hypothetical protein
MSGNKTVERYLGSIDDKLGQISQQSAITFDAQFDLDFEIAYTVGGVVTAASSINASLKTDLPVYVFGYADYKSNYQNGRNQLRVPNNWDLSDIVVSGLASQTEIATVYPDSKGDIVFVYEDTLSLTTKAFVKLSCQQVSMATVLESLASDRFVINRIRYNVSQGDENQFKRPIVSLWQSIFGQNGSDSVNPQVFVNPEQQQVYIADVPLVKVFDKETMLATKIMFGAQQFSWGVFVKSVDKLM